MTENRIILRQIYLKFEIAYLRFTFYLHKYTADF